MQTVSDKTCSDKTILGLQQYFAYQWSNQLGHQDKYLTLCKPSTEFGSSTHISINNVEEHMHLNHRILENIGSRKLILTFTPTNQPCRRKYDLDLQGQRQATNYDLANYWV